MNNDFTIQNDSETAYFPALSQVMQSWSRKEQMDLLEVGIRYLAKYNKSEAEAGCFEHIELEEYCGQLAAAIRASMPEPSQPEPQPEPEPEARGRIDRNSPGFLELPGDVQARFKEGRPGRWWF